MIKRIVSSLAWVTALAVLVLTATPLTVA